MSTTYFSNFKKIRYKFGDETSSAIMQDLSQYVDLIDQVKANGAFYQDYIIPSGERPDTLSFRLYGTTDYYWTFFLLNDHLRESGWPLDNEDVLPHAEHSYPHRVITSRSNLATKPYDFKVGALIVGSETGTIGNIIKRNLSLGQLVVNTIGATYTVTEDFPLTVGETGSAEISLTESNKVFADTHKWLIFQDGELIQNYFITLSSLDTKAVISSLPFNENSVYTVTAQVKVSNATDGTFTDGEGFYYFDPSTGHNVAGTVLYERAQYLATDHWEDADGNWVDIDPFTQVENPVGLTNVTNLDVVQITNDQLKTIKVFKKDVVGTVAQEFNTLMSQ